MLTDALRMDSLTRYRLRLVCCSLALIVSASSPVFATEPVLEFLEGLRERRYFDMALLYLDQVEDRQDLPEDIRAVLPYERAQTLLQSAKDLANLDAQRKQLDAAQASFEEFVKGSPNHPLAGQANTARGQILLEKARVDIWDGDKPSNKGLQDKFRKSARDGIIAARKIFEQARDQHKKTWEAFPTFIPEEQKQERAARDKAEELYIRAQLDLAQCTYWQAQTFDFGTKERNELLTKAAFEFEEIHQKYRSQMGGLYARIWQGKCFEEQGGEQGIGIALGIYEEILGHEGNGSAIQGLKDRALRFRLICLNSDVKQDYQLVVQEAEAWLREARDRARTDVGLGIQWELCRALEALATSRTTPENLKNNYLTQALTRARNINRYPGELKTPSAALIQRVMVALNREPGDPKDFATAYGNGGQLFDQISGLNGEISQLKSKGKMKEAASKAETRSATAAEMTRMYDLALRLATPADDAMMVNLARLRLSYGYLLQQKFFESAVVADNLMTLYGEKYPEVAREAGFIAMTAFDTAYSQADEDDRSFEARKLMETANKISERWPDSSRANDARNAVAKIHWNDEDYLQAAEWWNKIPAGTDQYADAQVRAGKAYWRQYVIEAAKPEGERATPQELGKWKQAAIDHLVTGLNEAEKSIPDKAPLPDELVIAKITLTNIRNLDGDYQAKEKGPPGALDLLTKEPHPILKAVEVPKGQKRPTDPGSAKSRRIASIAYQQLLRTWIGLKNLEEARKARAKLEEVAAGEDEAALTQVFVDFGRELEQELERLKASGDTKRLQEVRNGFEAFLNDLFKREDGQTFYSLLWIAETYTSLAEGTSDNPEKETEFFNKASQTYEKIIDKAASDPNFADKAQLVACKLRLVNCLRNQEAFDQAETVVLDILKENPNLPDAQFEASNLYQIWGKSGAGDSVEKFKLALYGKKEPVHVWGWTYTAQSLQRALYQEQDERLQELLFDARYNLAEAEQQFGLALTDPKESKNHLERARVAIQGFQRVSKRWPDEEYERFNELYKDILGDLGEPIVDLPRELADSERQSLASTNGGPAAEAPSQAAMPTPVVVAEQPAKPESQSSSLLMVLVLLVGGGAVAGLFFLFTAQSKKKNAARYGVTASKPSSTRGRQEEPPVFAGLPTGGASQAARPKKKAAVSSTAAKAKMQSSSAAPSAAKTKAPQGTAKSPPPAKPKSRPPTPGQPGAKASPGKTRTPRPKPPEASN